MSLGMLEFLRKAVPSGGRGRTLVSVAGFFVALLGVVVAGLFEARISPRPYWLAFDLGRLLFATVALNLAMVLGGARAFRLLAPNARIPLAERLLWGMTLGFLGFGLLMYALGFLGLYGPIAGVTIPLVLGAAGAGEMPRLWGEVRNATAAPAASTGVGRIVALGATLLGGLGVGLVYLEALTPDSFNFDAIWYHVPIAQDYARLGRIVPFFADNHRGYPHLASLLHTWALLVPGVDPLPLRWMLMLHLEFAMVLWRIVGALAIAQFLLQGRRVPGLWAVFFLYPSIFIYDQNIGGSADHVLGATAAPIALGLLRFLPEFRIRWAILTGLAAGVHMLTKYQAVYMVAAVALLTCGRALWFLFAGRVAGKALGRRLSVDGAKLPSWRATLLVPCLLAGVALAASSPHFLKNAVFYQNPFYPFARQAFPSSFEAWKYPSSKGAEKEDGADDSAAPAKKGGKTKASNATPVEATSPYDFRFKSRAFDWLPQGDGVVERVVWIHKTMLEWPFLTANRNLTNQRPYMGGLFVLLLPVAFLVRDRRRTLGALGVCYCAFGVWAATTANDRYLLSFLSVPIGVSAALLVRLSEFGTLARLGACLLVTSQAMTSFAAPFVYGGDRLTKAVQLAKRSTTAKSPSALYSYRAASLRLSEAIPRDAVVLGRYFKDMLGVDRMVLNTHEPIQTLIKFSKLRNERDLWRICRDRGITHLLYPPGKRQPELAQTLILFDVLFAQTEKSRSVSGVRVAELPKDAPRATEPLLVFVKGIREYDDGLYRVSQLNRTPKGVRPKPVPLERYRSDRVGELLARARASLLGSRALSGAGRDELEASFEKFESFGATEVWLKKGE